MEKVDDSTVAGDGVHENVAGTEDSAAAPVAEKAKARAIFDWTAINSNYLTITKGDVMEVVNQVEEAWWWMKKGDGQRGYEIRMLTISSSNRITLFCIVLRYEPH